MERKKVIFSLIQALSSDERQVFRKKIPNGGNSKTYSRLLAIFDFFENLVKTDNHSEIVRGLDLTKVVKVSSYKKLYPYYDELIADLKNFLILKEIDNQSLEKEILLQNALIKRGENVYLEELHSEIQLHITNIALPSSEEYYNRSSFYSNLYTHISTDSYKSDALLHLHQSENNLDIFYWIEKLRLLIKKANRATILSNEEFLLKELKTLPDLTIYTQHNEAHLLNIYVCVYQFALAPFQSEDLDHAIDLIKIAPNIPKEDSERILNYLNNVILYYVLKKNSAACNLSPKDIYKVYKLGFCNLWLVQKDERMLFEDFMNILNLAFYNKDFVFLEAISNDYEQYIPDGYAPFVEMLSKGCNFFLHQQWVAVIKVFSNQDSPPKPHKLHYIVQRNVLEIKSLFESLIQNNTELEDIPNTLEKHFRFTQREFNISDIGKDRNLHFVKLLKKIYPYLNKRIDFQFDKKVAEKEVMDWVQEVEASEGKTIEIIWLRSVGERLQAEFLSSNTH